MKLFLNKIVSLNRFLTSNFILLVFFISGELNQWRIENGKLIIIVEINFVD